MTQSRYDKLHDTYQNISTKKAGTRYERLAAIIFAAMNRDGSVIHDIVIRGETSGVGHQIDVHIEQAGTPRHILIECKDFDISGNLVGLSIVRNFSAVVADIRPSDAWILSCNGFTRDARKFAKAYGIKLATLRLFAESDWQNRLHTVIANLTVQHAELNDARLTFEMGDSDFLKYRSEFSDEQLQNVMSPEMDLRTVFDGSTERNLTSIVYDVGSRIQSTFKGEVYSETYEFAGWISSFAGTRYDLRGLRVDIPISRAKQEIRIVGVQNAARLLLTNGEGLDFVLWDDTLQGYNIDESGEVRLADEQLQEHLITTIVAL